MNSRDKGARGEREAAQAIAKVFQVEARRGQQFSGGDDSPDVVHGLKGLHVEVKRTEAFRLWTAMDQAIKDAGAGAKLPAVLHRKNNREWVLILKLADVPELCRIVMESTNAVFDQVPATLRQEQPAKPQT